MKENKDKLHQIDSEQTMQQIKFNPYEAQQDSDDQEPDHLLKRSKQKLINQLKIDKLIED
jgi:hypothetical protein